MKKLILIIITLFLASCSGLGENNSHNPNITIAAQPSKAELEKAKEDGHEIVINLRAPNEFKGYDEARYASELNLKYYNIPFFNKDKEIDQNSLKGISKVVKNNQNKKIYIHCSSGNRAAAWYLTYLLNHEGLSLEKALTIARESGLTKKGLEKKTLQMLSK